jgi:hypothetical protein
MYEWQFSPVDSSLPFALTDCTASSLLLRHSSSYAADCSHRTKRLLLLHVVLTHRSRDRLSESSYKQKSARKLYSSHAWSYERRELSMSKFSLWLTYSTCKNTKRKPRQKNQCVSTTQQYPEELSWHNDQNTNQITKVSEPGFWHSKFFLFPKNLNQIWDSTQLPTDGRWCSIPLSNMDISRLLNLTSWG